MNFLLVLVSVTVAIAACDPIVEQNQLAWDAWKSENRKEYKDEADEKKHKELFFERLAMVKTHNNNRAGSLYVMGLNHLADKTPEEIQAMLGTRVPEDDEQVQLMSVNAETLTTKPPVTTAKPTTVRPITTKKPTTVKPVTTTKPTTVKPPTTPKPTTTRKTTVKPTTLKPTTTKKTTTVRPKTTGKPTTVKPTTVKPVTIPVLPSTTKAPTPSGPLPASVDWRTKGVLTTPKNQGGCGSCWSFAASGALEAYYSIKTGKSISLSEQQLVDCSSSYGNHGCSGGWMNNAFKYVHDSEGLNTEEAYPYVKSEKQCAFNNKTEAKYAATALKSYATIPSNNETAVMAALVNGPLVIAIDAGLATFQMYKSGIYSDPKCSSTTVNHGVLLVGYGSEGGIDYWIVKNSWGPSWGESGYVRMLRNGSNFCCILSFPSYPVLM